MRRTLLGAAAIVAVTVALAGCTAGGSSGRDAGSERDEGGSSVGGSGGSGSAPSVADPAAVPAVGPGGASPDAARDIVTTGFLLMTVPKPLDAATDAVRIAAEAGGRVDAREEFAATDTSGASAVLTLRIPADRLDAALDELTELGRADELSTTASDVTVQRTDLEARISALRASLDRFTTLVGSAATTADLIELETAIADRQAQLDGLEAQQRGFADQIAMSTLSVTLRSEQQAPPRNPGDFLSGLATGWSSLLGFLGALLVGLGVALPWAIVPLVALTAVLVRRRRRGQAAAGAVAPAEAPLSPPPSG